VLSLLAHPQSYQRAVRAFPLTGLEVMRQRLEEFCEPTQVPEQSDIVRPFPRLYSAPR
jgi:hypothetical protein